MDSNQRYETKSEWVESRLRAAIASGELRPGRVVRIQDWAKRLGVSATPVREALKGLAAAGYIRINAHRGADVARFSSNDYFEYFRLREVLDGLAVELATERTNDVARRRLHDTLESVNRELQEALVGADRPRVRMLEHRFHSAFYEACESLLLASTAEPLWRLNATLDQVVWETIVASNWSHDHIAQHRQILVEFLKGDAKKAAEAARNHKRTDMNVLAEVAARFSRDGRLIVPLSVQGFEENG